MGIKSPHEILEHPAIMRALFVVTSGGFEPPAYRLGGGRSIQLSYEVMFCCFKKLHSRPFAIRRRLFTVYQHSTYNYKFAIRFCQMFFSSSCILPCVRGKLCMPQARRFAFQGGIIQHYRKKYPHR